MPGKRPWQQDNAGLHESSVSALDLLLVEGKSGGQSRPGFVWLDIL